jgi:hypothetical protein
MRTTTEHPTATRSTVERQIGAGGAPLPERSRPPAVRVAESVLGGWVFVLLGFVLPVAGVLVGLRLLLRRLAQTCWATWRRPGEAQPRALGMRFEPRTPTQVASPVRAPAIRFGPPSGAVAGGVEAAAPSGAAAAGR